MFICFIYIDNTLYQQALLENNSLIKQMNSSVMELIDLLKVQIKGTDKLTPPPPYGKILKNQLAKRVKIQE